MCKIDQKKYHYKLGTHCWYCKREYGILGLVFKNKAIFRTKDHIIPISQKGRNNIKNYIGCCNECNCLKSNRTPIEFIYFIDTLNKKHNMYSLFQIIKFQSWKIYNKTNRKLQQLHKPKSWSF